MVKLVNVNKYFYRYKKNQIHAINNANLEFEDKGLVAILGNSGCGKTTLLNSIGGLDKVNKGKIYINGKKITKRTSGSVDKIRAVNIGYIFQNYNLINYLTVFENVALALKISGIKNKKEIETRVSYILNKLGIYKYRNRLANMLSGGERQRVAIARALVKNPNIIISDEPTGNLDSKNSLEIMNIIKAISKEKLVILVTHERNLAEFYASRIIEIVDGKVMNDRINEYADELDYRLENKIYLKDLSVHQNIKEGKFNIDIYADEKDKKGNNEKIDVKIILKNGNLYIESGNKAELVEENSSIELVDEHYKKLSKEEANQYKFDYDKIINKKYKTRYTSIYNIFTLLINGVKKVFNYSVLKKFLLLGFVASSMFILYGVSNVFGTLDIKDEKFVKKNANYLDIIMPNIDIEKYLEYEKLEQVNYIMPGSSQISFYMKYDDYYQTQNNADTYSGSLSSLDLITDKDLIYGRMPENKMEVVLDKIVINRILGQNYNNAKQSGVIAIDNYLERNITFGNAYSSSISPLENFKIVGIIDMHSPSIYTDKDMFINILANTEESSGFQYFAIAESTENKMNSNNSKVIDVSLMQDRIELIEGRMPENDYEIIVNESNKSTMKLNKTIDEKVNGTKLKVVGYYKSKYELDYYFSNINTIKYELLTQNSNITVCPKEKIEAINYFSENGVVVQDSYEKSKEEYKKSIKENIVASLVVAGIIIGISLIEIYLMMRSSFLSRVKEVGILRAIGVKKKDIYKMFLGEILAITILTGTIGISLMSYVLKGLSQVSYFSDSIMINWKIIGLGCLIFLVFNVVVGLMPVHHTIKKTPAKILSSNNVD